jgi:hypothetical protein
MNAFYYLEFFIIQIVVCSLAEKNEFVGSLENGDFCPIEAKVRQKSNFAQIF